MVVRRGVRTPTFPTTRGASDPGAKPSPEPTEVTPA